jgi:hypothetical protein
MGLTNRRDLQVRPCTAMRLDHKVWPLALRVAVRAEARVVTARAGLGLSSAFRGGAPGSPSCGCGARSSSSRSRP